MKKVSEERESSITPEGREPKMIPVDSRIWHLKKVNQAWHLKKENRIWHLKKENQV